MAIPMALVPLIASTLLSAGLSMYGTTVNTKASDRVAEYTSNYELARMMENDRYFQNYLRAHHIEHRRIEYPYRTGMVYNQSNYLNAGATQIRNQTNRFTSYVGGANSLFGLYGRTRYNNFRSLSAYGRMKSNYLTNI